MNKQASCCCGAVTVELSGTSKLNALCHCDDCRKRTGSAFGHSLYYSKDTLKIIGSKPKTYAIGNEYGNQVRHFCPECGSTVYWYWARFPEWVGVAAGCMKDVVPAPTISACHHNARHWVTIPESWAQY
ncbi:GFA family protein [Pseudomaricurvus alkylphenolicus]|uniref:GFA family protein n=1 Tax=Pseudomaricurvus alkylphenolicus TaxID=1306991 RepID=UPI00141EF7C6|nr:GFA family protein [Pseudomaricurvus alkylphenolicus]NIB42655.1 GFA family protein [Pseudomaricurvus alkylphenolicus]